MTFAAQLKGDLLVVHGSGDDNVHYQNTEALVNALVKANKPFTMMAYPNRTHCICEGDGTPFTCFRCSRDTCGSIYPQTKRCGWLSKQAKCEAAQLPEGAESRTAQDSTSAKSQTAPNSTRREIPDSAKSQRARQERSLRGWFALLARRSGFRAVWDFAPCGIRRRLGFRVVTALRRLGLRAVWDFAPSRSCAVSLHALRLRS